MRAIHRLKHQRFHPLQTTWESASDGAAREGPSTTGSQSERLRTVRPPSLHACMHMKTHMLLVLVLAGAHISGFRDRGPDRHLCGSRSQTPRRGNGVLGDAGWFHASGITGNYFLYISGC
eukprot:scaffold15401_cov98-Isochrysis_galbana.AAC.4